MNIDRLTEAAHLHRLGHQHGLSIKYTEHRLMKVVVLYIAEFALSGFPLLRSVRLVGRHLFP